MNKRRRYQAKRRRAAQRRNAPFHHAWVHVGRKFSALRDQPIVALSREKCAELNAVGEFMAREYARVGYAQNDDDATPAQEAALKQLVAEAQATETYDK